MRKCWFCGKPLASRLVNPAGDWCQACNEWTPPANTTLHYAAGKEV